MTRRKAQLVDAILSIEEARDVAGTYAALDAKVASIEAERLVRLAAVNKDCDERIASRTDDMKRHFARLKAWWEAGGSEVAGKKRSTEFGGVILGIRLTTPKLTLPKGTSAKQVVDELLNWLGGEFVKTKHSLEKAKIIARLRSAPPEDDDEVDAFEWDVLADKLKLTVTQKDEFFIAPVAKPADTEEMPA